MPSGTHDEGGIAAADAPSKPRLDMVRKLAFPRFTGGEGERRAMDLVETEMRSTGLDVHREAFRAGRGALFRLRLFAHGVAAILIVAMAAVAPAQPGAAATLGALTLLLFAGAARWPRVVESAFDLGESFESGNVTGHRPGRDHDPLCIVVMAHHDTKSSRLPTFFPAIILIAVVLFVLGTAALALGAWGRGQPGPSVLPAAVGLAALLVAVVWNRAGDESPGAMDNASGLAVLLAVARDLPRDPALAGVDLRFVSTGAEELGLIGALRWIQAHAPELDARRTLFVNVDSVGVGRRIHAADVRGAAPGGRPLGKVIRQAARVAGVPYRRLVVLPAVGVDTFPIGARGFPTVTLLGEVLGGASRRIHSRRDTVDHLNETGLENARRLVVELAREVVRGAPR